MGFFSTQEFNSLDELFAHQLRDLYDAEHRLCDAIPKMADAAESPQLKKAFNDHLQETKSQVKRLETVFQEIGEQPKRVTCDAMKGLVSEGDDVIGASGDPAVKDAALIAAAQRVEHYEMAGYGTARALARQLGHNRAAEILQETLDEESHADTALTELAERSINLQAAQA